MDSSTLSRPPKTQHNFRRAAILFAGGPAPAANAVISAAATSFLRNDIEVVGIKHGYSNLIDYSSRQVRWSKDARLCDGKSPDAGPDTQHLRHHDRHSALEPWQACFASLASHRP